MFKQKKLLPVKRIVFTLTLKHKVTEDYVKTDNYGHEQHRTYDNLTPGMDFAVRYRKFRKLNDNNGMANYSDVRDFCEHIINDEIANELRELVDLPIKEVKVNRTYEGSLILVFSVLFNIYQFIGGISGFLDTIKLIENTVKRHMKKRLNDEFSTNGYFEIDVNSETVGDYIHMLEDVHYGLKRRGTFPVPIYEPSYHPKRDSLFWYLLVSNIFLLIFVGILVWKAVFNMYW